MTRYFVGVMLVGALALGGACGKKDKDKAKEPPKPTAKTTEEPKEPPPPKDLTPEERIAAHKACWDAFNAKDAAKFGTCYTEDASLTMMDGGPAHEGRDAIMNKLIQAYWTAFPDAKGTPQVTLLSGDRLVSIDAYMGTNTGEFMGMPATNKKVGYYFLQDNVMTGAGQAQTSNLYVDMGTVMAQLGASPAPSRPALEAPGESIVAIAADDDKEKANLEIAKKTNELFNAHDVKGLFELYSDDVLFRDITMPADITGKKDMKKGLEGFYKAFPDLKAEYGDIIAAGDYVAMFSTMTGTNKGPMKEAGLKKGTNKTIEIHGAEVIKIVDGKVTEHWMFANGMAFAIQLGLMPDPAAAQPEGTEETE